MKLSLYPKPNQWRELCERPQFTLDALNQIIAPIFDDIQREGLEAVLRYTRQFDGVNLTAKTLQVTTKEIQKADDHIDWTLREAIVQAHHNIRQFHKAQYNASMKVETMPGVLCERRAVPIEKVGLYVPGGSAPLFSSVLMLALPAMIAGCDKVILCTPPDAKGGIHPAILYTARICGIQEIYKLGGAQAIAAMTLGAGPITPVDKLFGPGNQYVTAAKMYATRYGVAIDMPAGPSEVAIVADETCPPVFIAADLLAQAEHGTDSQVMLVTTSQDLVRKVEQELAQLLAQLPRADIAAQTLVNSHAVVLKEDQLIPFINRYAPEHLILASSKADRWVDKVINAGSVFIGLFTPESFGDYASGTNHTLPTQGWARSYSGVSLDSFFKFITYQTVTQDGFKALRDIVVNMAKAEELEAHALAVTVREDYLEVPPTLLRIQPS
jgi:histidinol dehydrogenase